MAIVKTTKQFIKITMNLYSRDLSPVFYRILLKYVDIYIYLRFCILFQQFTYRIVGVLIVNQNDKFTQTKGIMNI